MALDMLVFDVSRGMYFLNSSKWINEFCNKTFPREHHQPDATPRARGLQAPGQPAVRGPVRVGGLRP